MEKFRTGEYEVKNLMVIDEAITRLLDVGGVKFRLMGLGGSLQMSKICECEGVDGVRQCLMADIVESCVRLMQSTMERALVQSQVVVGWFGQRHYRSVNW